MEKNEALKKFLLRLGDNALIQGHRLSEWCSRGPMLEEDIALSNLALDNIGRAQAFLDYAGHFYSNPQSADDLAFKRSERQYYNFLMAELPVGHFGYTIAKQLYISAYEELLFEALTQSTDDTIAAIAHKAVKEARYHFSHAADWCVRLGLGTAESHDKLGSAMSDLWAYTQEFFEMTDGDLQLLQLGIAPDQNQIKKVWTDKVNKVFMRAGYVMPGECHQYSGSQQGVHTEYLGHLLCEMQYLQRSHPQAAW
ncbi:MAG: phenylacetate-CoA oxygenase subunit PaaC [Saprospiraceae bacterium]|nr:phenylacetate-CoA oxygenase subunit PaaC [Saprospiraceae bacterium]MBK7788230.1 phenylacetate-CoA oxygenase subunit PaaC [Saprospiraceae bacterium]MBK8852075.1 phenylacetate-CoA oxygenase subunit PaaC [Saprospiraceae bacterium]MBK9689539.1 phenylacetate-CoA oxygenase subunit PaaC [Saprospiraceae bacterium]